MPTYSDTTTLLLSSSAASSSLSTIKSSTHLVIFVHGYWGNEKELEYLRTSMDRQATCTNLVFFSPRCNVGKTSDGIANGGKRLAAEVKHQIDAIEGHVRLSFVAFSLGGLYSRYAISKITFDDEHVTPFIFCTISTPHLGLHNQHNHLKLSNRMENVIGKVLGQTSQDMLEQTPLLQKMGTSEKYLAPLRRFRKRMALANAYRTDFMVPAQTAAFLSSNRASGEGLHIATSKPEGETIDSSAKKSSTKAETHVLSVETSPCQNVSEKEPVACLDALGWTKTFLDVRDEIPFPSIPKLSSFKRKRSRGEPTSDTSTKTVWTSKELVEVFDRPSADRWNLPLAHPVSSANAKNSLYRRLSARGQPTMDQLARDLLSVVYTNTTTTSTGTPDAIKAQSSHYTGVPQLVRTNMARTLCVGSFSFEDDGVILQ
jgi:hypothetical protein